MKQLFICMAALLIAAPAFAQTKAPTTAPKTTKPDSIHAGKPATKPNTEANPGADEVIKNIEANMITVVGGTFNMGCTDDRDSCYGWEKPAHKVTVNTFAMCKYVVTQKEWKAIMRTTPWFSPDCANCPADNISWYRTQIFINTLNQMTGKNFRLPTEAEWEYAARGGVKNKGHVYAGSNNINTVGWYDDNSDKKTHPVGQKKPNELGLYDMSGNVWQWCSDWFGSDYYANSPDKNPTGPAKDTHKVLRGGSWWEPDTNCRVANRDRYSPSAADDDIGFRLVLEVE